MILILHIHLHIHHNTRPTKRRTSKGKTGPGTARSISVSKHYDEYVDGYEGPKSLNLFNFSNFYKLFRNVTSLGIVINGQFITSDDNAEDEHKLYNVFEFKFDMISFFCLLMQAGRRNILYNIKGKRYWGGNGQRKKTWLLDVEPIVSRASDLPGMEIGYSDDWVDLHRNKNDTIIIEY